MSRVWIVGLAAVAALGVAGTARADDAPYCREYQRNVVIGGKVQESYGTACMTPDGSWRIADGEDVGESFQVANMDDMAEPMPTVVYEEPVYTAPFMTDYRYYPGPGFGLSMGWSDHDGWRGGRGHGWHGGHHRY